VGVAITTMLASPVSGAADRVNDQFHEFALPLADSYPRHIVAGPDLDVWFTEYSGRKIGRIDTAGVLTEFPIGAVPGGITIGPDGNIWFTEFNASKIGRLSYDAVLMDPVLTEFPIPTAGSGPFGIASGPDGNIWFAEFGGN